MMKNILLGSIFAFAMMTTTGCYETNSAVKTATPCASGKCGAGKCSKAMKCGTGKCGTKKCGSK